MSTEVATAKENAQTALRDHSDTCTECTSTDRCNTGRALLADLFEALDRSYGRESRNR